jgi:hypothetical protein
MRGLLPEALCERPFKTDFEALTRIGLFEREAATVRALLTNPRCEQLGFVNGDWIRQVLARGGQLDSQELYWFWKTISLELWLGRVTGPRDPSQGAKSGSG